MITSSIIPYLFLPLIMRSCAHCKDNVDERNAISCVICSKWFAIKCIDISSAEARKIKANVGLNWTCTGCCAMGQSFNELKQLIVGLQAEVLALTNALNKRDEVSSQYDFESVVREVQERESRRNNVIVFGLVEDVGVDVSKRRESDLKNVRDIATELSVLVDDGDAPVRLGKLDASHPERPRPLRFRLRNQSDIRSLFRNAAKLKSCDRWKNVRLASDRTPLQNKLYRAVRDELENRKRSGERDLRIVYRKGVPVIISMVPGNE